MIRYASSVCLSTTQVILPFQRVFTAADVVTALKNAVPTVAKIIDEDGGWLTVGRSVGSCRLFQTPG